ncbi:coiled-coil domain-containing protein 93-like isoform X1 [Pomacea canaliculata]|uniref:coiled-coil domain-containing protein 93-like isoform X1 n=1 Tax=Pomacea canaliculata TaxID=400727 RepID=UPI000D72EC82|nr:coiled-coil domain-containing protein 93-like isoform X1 [Pomacea canaliculata]
MTEVKMAASVFAGRSRTGSSRLPVQIDVDGNEAEIETREDEEQNVKLQETIELLLAAGYFRARIKGLSPFDKVVGGMTWCITTCNFDVDVDLLFQENSTIGQKIALTEKIVAVLPRMKCPHNIEPHQIQGLDFIHIYPVVQWLVKRAIETREEMGDFIRAFSVSQFSKHYSTPEDLAFEAVKSKAVTTVNSVKDVYRPQRRYKRHDADKLYDEETRVHSTLLEYGRRYGVGRSEKEEEEEKASKKRSVAAGLAGKETEKEIDLQEEEERRIKALMSSMSATGIQEGRLTASAVGSIVGMQSQQIQQIASEYANKQVEIEQIEKSERIGGAQQHKRITAALNKQIEQQHSRLIEIQTKHDELHKAYLETQEKLKEVQERGAVIDKEMEKLTVIETEENQSILTSLRSLVALNESLKKQEQEFKAHCKDEMARLKDNIEHLKHETDEADSDDKQRAELVNRQYEADKEKLHKIRLLLARKNREIALLQRKIDEVPSRAELSQYQRRFVELYNQVSSTHRETKQFYTLYNTLDDAKRYISKEVTLLNSIHDNFKQAMSSPANKEQFLKQFEQIVEGIKQNREKVEKRRQEEKMRRDVLNDQYLDLLEKQRLYFKTVKEFKEECRKNEILLTRLRSG